MLIMRDRLSPKGTCSWSLNLFKFWEISDNILEIMPDSRCYYGPVIRNNNNNRLLLVAEMKGSENRNMKKVQRIKKVKNMFSTSVQNNCG